jgi:hypothetical protein
MDRPNVPPNARAPVAEPSTYAARPQFTDFLELWKEADPDLPEVIEARRRQ